MMSDNGLQSWLCPATFTSTCKIDITYFPFDRQECKLKFGSWTFDVAGVDMQADTRPVITSQYLNSSEWEIADAKQSRNLVRYGCCPTPYADVTVYITLRRKPLYYVFNVISPCLVLAATILFGFFLPPESGERISLTITILLAVAVFLQLVSDNLPRNSDSIPILAIFYMVIMAESALSLITTCVVLVFHYRSTERTTQGLPDWVRRVFFDLIGKYLRVKRPRRRNQAISRISSVGDLSQVEFPSIDPTLPAECISYSNIAAENGIRSPSVIHSSQNGILNKGSAKSRGKTQNENISLQESDHKNCNSALDSILTEVRVMSENVRYSHQLEEHQEEWKYLSLVLDRIFFWIFLLTLSISALATLLPTYFKHN